MPACARNRRETALALAGEVAKARPAIVGLQEVAVGREDPARERVEAAVLSQFFPVLMPAELTASTGRRIHVLDR